jgi:uncharacterized protein (DUF427 family)
MGCWCCHTESEWGMEMAQERGGVRAERGHKRLRALVGGQVVLDTRRPLMVWEHPYYPTYYVPADDLLADVAPTGATERTPSRGVGHVCDLVVEGRRVPAAALVYPEPELEAIRDHVRVSWDAVDGWFEEDEEVFVHARDPYKRVDVLPSSRHVVVEVDGVRLADSSRPTMVFETMLIARTYLPALDVRQDLLVPSETVTRCPYKGTAAYLHLRAGEVAVDDVAWTYRFPVRESAGIAGLICFHDEKVDVIIDGERQQRPSSRFVT